MSVFGYREPASQSGVDGAEKEYVDSQDALRVLKSGDTMGGDLNMGGHRIVGAADPTDPQDVSTAAFVLDTATQLKAGLISRDGTPSATMQADLDLDGNGLVRVREPFGPQDAATKNYADTKDKLRVLKSGDTMSGPLTIDTSATTTRESIIAKTGVADVVIENRGLSVDWGNIAVGQAAGGADLDIRQTSGGIRLRNSGDTEFFQLGLNTSGRLELRKSDDTSDLTTVCEFTGSHITSLSDPTSAQDAATKSYVDTLRGRTYITVWAEENSGMNSGEHEWSFGNGSSGADHARIGYVMLAPGRVVRMGLTTTRVSGPSGAVRVNLVVNGAQQTHGVTKPQSLYSGTAIFATPLELLRGDRINFRSSTTDASVTRAIVSLLIELDM